MAKFICMLITKRTPIASFAPEGTPTAKAHLARTAIEMSNVALACFATIGVFMLARRGTLPLFVLPSIVWIRLLTQASAHRDCEVKALQDRGRSSHVEKLQMLE